MKASDLKRVGNLMSDLEKAKSKHETYANLTKKGGGSFGFDPVAYVRIGGDIYGNGRVRDNVEFKILEIPEIANYCRKLESDAWGEVVSIMATLRSLGVEL